MKLSSALSQSSSKHSHHANNNKNVNLEQLEYTTPNKKDTSQRNKSKSTEKKLFLTQLKHPFHSTIQDKSSISNRKFNKTVPNQNNQTITISNQTPIKEITNSQKPLPESPFNKNCFSSRSCRTLLTVNQIKKNHHQNTSSTQHLTRSLQLNQQTSPKKPLLTSRQPSVVNDSTRSIQPTHYTSVKLFMSSKFKKGRKEKLPVNILAYPQTIHEKETTDSVLSTSCVRNLKFEQTFVVREEPPSPAWKLRFQSKYTNANV